MLKNLERPYETSVKPIIKLELNLLRDDIVVDFELRFGGGSERIFKKFLVAGHGRVR